MELAIDWMPYILNAYKNDKLAKKWNEQGIKIFYQYLKRTYILKALLPEII